MESQAWRLGLETVGNTTKQYNKIEIMKMPSLQKPDATKQLIIQAFEGLLTRTELDIQSFRCTEVGKWIEFRVILGGDHSFRIFFGATRKVLSYCRKMCSNGRRYVQGVTVNPKLGIDEIKRKIANCIIAVRTAFSCGNHSVVSESDSDEFGFISRHDRSVVMPSKREPLFRSSMTGLEFA